MLSKLLTTHRKTLTAVVGAGIGFATLVVVSPSGPVTAAEWLSGGVGLATALGVYATGNKGA